MATKSNNLRCTLLPIYLLGAVGGGLVYTFSVRRGRARQA